MEKLQDEKLKKILMELAEMLCEVYRDKLKAVILYGSVARGTATEDSDVDIMVLVDGTEIEIVGVRHNKIFINKQIRIYKY